MTERTLKDRVSDRLLELRINAFEASRAGGLGREFVNDILRGRKKTVRGDNLVKLAAALETTPEFLIGSNDKAYESFDFPRIVGDVPLIGVVASGRWKDSNEILSLKKYASAQRLGPDVRFPDEDQIDFAVEDDSIADIAPAGSFLRCIVPSKWRPDYPINYAYVVDKFRGEFFETRMEMLKVGDRGSGFRINTGGFGMNEVEEVFHPFDRMSDPIARTVGVVLYAYFPLTHAR